MIFSTEQPKLKYIVTIRGSSLTEGNEVISLIDEARDLFKNNGLHTMHLGGIITGDYLLGRSYESLSS